MASGARPQLDILFLDDEELVRREAGRDLKDRLSEGNLEASVDAVATLADALDRLKSKPFHVAVIDIRLQDPQADGNLVIRQIMNTQILPIIVYTGFREELESDFQGNRLIHVVASKKMGNVAAKILEWHSKRILEFFSERGFVTSWFHRALLVAMWTQLPQYWDDLPLDDTQRLDQIVARIALALFQETLGSSPEFVGTAGEVVIHPGETYVLGTPREYLATGDVVRSDETRYVVLTPACDLIPRGPVAPKAPVVLLAECTPLKEFSKDNEELQRALRDLDNKPPQGKRIERIMRQAGAFNNAGQYFLLPPFGSFGGGAIDFLKLKTVPHDEAGRRSLVDSRVVCLSRETVSELVSRFVRYTSRLGLPAYDADHLINVVKRVKL